MVIVNTSWQRWAAGLAVSLVIFMVLYLTVVQPSTNTANQAVKTGMQQTRQAIKQARQQINTASNEAGAATGHANQQVAAARAQAHTQLAAAGAQANKQLDQAGKLSACVAAAGTDTGKLQACQVKYTP